MTDRVTTEEAAERLGVPADQVAKWKHRGDVQPVGWIRGRGRGGRVPVYRLEELEPLAEEYRRRVARRKRRATRRTSDGG